MSEFKRTSVMFTMPPDPSTSRREFLAALAAGGAALLTWRPVLGLQTLPGIENPLKYYPARDWEKVYRDQYRYDRTFTFVCAPNDTHNCRLRAFVRNGIFVRAEQNYDSGRVGDLYGNTATNAWNPRGCAKGYQMQKRVYGPYRLSGPLIRVGWKQWADDGFPSLSDNPELREKYKFNTRGLDTFVRVGWDEAYAYHAKAAVAIAKTYSGEVGAARLTKDGYEPEMIEAAHGAGTRCFKLRGGMGLLGVMGKQFSKARNLVKYTDLLEETKTKLYRIVSQEEEKFAATLDPSSGWFGESLIEGMKKLPTPGEYLWTKDKSTMVFVSQGHFHRGSDNPSDNAFPSKQIYLSSYYIDKYEITNAQYSQFVSAVGHKETPFSKTVAFQGHDFPVVGINWNDANLYAKWAEKRLPTEAEWEKACKGGEHIPDWQTQSNKISLFPNPIPARTYPWGETQPSVSLANYRQLSPPYDPYSRTSPVGFFSEGTSPYLCEDMMGNVMEWCYDQFDKAQYQSQETKNPRGPKHRHNESHVCRGGDWETDAFSLFSYKRYPYHPDSAYNTLGFRLVKDLGH